MKILMTIVLALLVGCDGEAYKQWSAEREAKKEAKRKLAERKARLSVGPGGQGGWQYLNEGDVQYKAGDEYMLLRKVKADDHVVVGSINEGGEFGTAAFWKVDCKEGTQIESSLTYGDYTPVELDCVTFGSETWLYVYFFWTTARDEAPYWAADFDGFAVDEDFSTWDWTKVRQHATLQRAKMPEPEQEQAE